MAFLKALSQNSLEIFSESAGIMTETRKLKYRGLEASVIFAYVQKANGD